MTGVLFKKVEYPCFILEKGGLLIIRDNKGVVLFRDKEGYKEITDTCELVELRKEAYGFIVLDKIEESFRKTLKLKWYQRLKSLKKRKDIIWLKI